MVVFYLLDISESTRQVSDKLRQWLLAELENSKDSVSLILFNYYPHEITLRPIELSERNFSCLKFYVNQFNIIGGTNLASAIKKCLGQAKKGSYKNFRIKVITDGLIANTKKILDKKYLGNPIRENIELLVYQSLS